MAINLGKIQNDLGHKDPQIQTFALISVTRLSPNLVDQPSQVRDLHDKLEHLIRSPNPDVVFLARKATNHLKAHFRDLLLGPSPAPAPAPEAVDEAEAQAEVPPAGAEPEASTEPEAPVESPAAPAPEAPPEPPPSPKRAEPSPVPSRPQDPAKMDREALLAELRQGDAAPERLSSLVIRLVDKGQTQDLPAIAPLLRHANDRVRSNALEVFVRHGGADHIELVKPLAQDASNRVRGTALLALERFGFPGVGRALHEMLEMPTISMRETAVWVLSQIEKPGVAPLLVKATEDPYDGIRLRAVRALAKYPTRESVRALKQALNDIDINICEAASESLRNLKMLIQGANAKRTQPPPPATPTEGKPPPAEADPTPQAGPPTSPEAASAKPDPEATPAPEAGPRASDPVEAGTPEGDPGASLLEAIEAPTQAPDDEPIMEAGAGRPVATENMILFRDLGTVVYQLCRLNSVTHDRLDSRFYEVLRYQDFLRAYLLKKQKAGPDGMGDEANDAIRQLQTRVGKSFVELGRIAFELIESKEIRVPEERTAEVQNILVKLRG